MRFIARRLIFYVVAAWSAITINFFIPRLMPGNPLEAFLAQHPGLNFNAQGVKALAVELGSGRLHTSLISQYGTYLVDIGHLNFGASYSDFPTSAFSIIMNALPWTVVLVGSATVIAFVIGTLIGIIAAWRRGGFLDGVLPGLTFFQAVPYFFLALILIDVLAVHLRWFPIGAGQDFTATVGWNWTFISSALDHSVLPAFTIAITSIAGWAVGMRNVMITTIGEEYVLAGQAKGLSNWRVVMTYAARNAILPNIAGFANALGLVISGAIIMEYVFAYPGIGYLTFNAVTSDDYSVMQGIFLVISISVLLANLIADVVYIFLDPRTRRMAAH